MATESKQVPVFQCLADSGVRHHSFVTRDMPHFSWRPGRPYHAGLFCYLTLLISSVNCHFLVRIIEYG